MTRVSVIIATYNRGGQLVRTLDSLLSQTLGWDRWEVIVVNNNSTDDTAEVFEKFVSENPAAKNMRMVFEARQGLSHARNRGIAESVGDYIVIIDDDEEVNPQFVESYLGLFDSYPDSSAAGGGIVPCYDFELPSWMSRFTDRIIAGTLDLGDEITLFRGRHFPGGGNMAVRRSVLDSVGLFNPDLGRTGTKLLAGEEKDLFRRIADCGGKIYYVPNAVIRHIIPRQRVTKEYLAKVARMNGASERVRTRGTSLASYLIKLLGESIKWCGTFVYAIGYLLTGRASKAGTLFILRTNITLGLLGFKKR